MSHWYVQNQHATAYFLDSSQQVLRVALKNKKSLDSLTQEEQAALWDLLTQARKKLGSEIQIRFSPHHIDILTQQNLLHDVASFHTGGAQHPFYPSIRALLSRATHIDIVTAFIQDSGLRILKRNVECFSHSSRSRAGRDAEEARRPLYYST